MRCFEKRAKTKNPEVLLTRSPRPVARVRPLLTCTRSLSQLAPIRTARDHLRSGSGLTANRENRLTPRDSILPLTCFPVLLNQRVAIDPYFALRHFFATLAGVTFIRIAVPMMLAFSCRYI